MNEWWSPFVGQPPFIAESGGVGDHLNPPTHEFVRHFQEGHCVYLGRGKRQCGFKQKEIINKSFVDFCNEQQMEVPNGYRQSQPSLEASFKSIAKYDRPPPVVDEAIWRLADEWMRLHFYPFMGGSGILSQEAAIRNLNKQTSAGFPSSMKYQTKNDLLRESGTEMITQFWDHLAEDKIIPIWSCSQKREILKIEKIEDGKIRTFTASPIEHSVALSRFCLDMNDKFYSSNNLHWSFVGGNKFSGGWNRLYERLSKHKYGFCLDETDYDCSLFPWVFEDICEFRIECLEPQYRTEENKQKLRNLYKDICYSVIILENGEIIRKFTGNPSGSANTIVDNTLALFKLFAYAWIKIMLKEYGIHNRNVMNNLRGPVAAREGGVVYGSYACFMDCVEAALNGDDNTFSVAEEVIGVFNARSIKAVWDEIGVTTKTDDFNPRLVKDLDFLSQNFTTTNSGYVVPMPNEKKVLCSLLYGSNLDDVRWHLLRALALKIDSFYNPVCRDVLTKYIWYLKRRYPEQLVGTVVLRPGVEIRMLEIMSVFKTDSWIEKLYCGFECDWPNSQENNLNKEFYQLNIEQYSGESIIMVNNKNKKIKKEVKAVLKNIKKSTGPSKQQRLLQSARDKALAKKAPVVIRERIKVKQSYQSKVNKMNSNCTPGIVTVTNSAPVTRTGMQREKIANISGTADFNVSSYYVNIGNSALFARGSQLAAVYDKYRFKHLHFEFLTESYTGNATGASAGKVVLVTNYDAAAADFDSSEEAELYYGAARGVTYNNIQHTVRAATQNTDGFNSVKNYYVNNGNNTSIPAGESNVSVHDFNVGIFQVITEGQAVTTEIGELWVVYDVEFLVPKAPLYSDVGPMSTHYSFVPITGTNFASATAHSGNSGQMIMTFPSNNTFTLTTTPSLPNQPMLIAYHVKAATSSTLTTWTVDAGTALNMLDGSTVATSIVGSGGTTINVISTVKTNSSGVLTVSLSSPTVTGAATADLIISAMPLTLITEEEEATVKGLQEKLARLETRFQNLLINTDEEDYCRAPEPPSAINPPTSSRTTPRH